MTDYDYSVEEPPRTIHAVVDKDRARGHALGRSGTTGEGLVLLIPGVLDLGVELIGTPPRVLADPVKGYKPLQPNAAAVSSGFLTLVHALV